MAKFQIGKSTNLTVAGDDHYHDEVAALWEAEQGLTDSERAEGVHADITLVFPSDPEEKEQEQKDGSTKTVTVDVPLARHMRYFQDSAKAIGKTARKVSQKPQGDGSVAVKFVLVEQIKRPRKGADLSAVVAEDEQTADAA